MGGRILVTRPQPEAARTARRLEALGFDAVELPLTRIVGLPVDEDSIPGAVDILAVTSANALRHAPDGLLALHSGTPLFAVGGRTAELSRQKGFRTVVEGSGDAMALAETVLAAAAPRATILFLCGRERLDRFETVLTAAGRSVVAVETYDTQTVDQDGSTLPEQLGAGQFAAVLLYSANAARHFAVLAGTPGVAPLVAEARLLCLSSRVAAALDGRIVEIAREPTEAALLTLLGPAANAS